MAIRRFAFIFGLVYTLVGIAGFIPALLSPPPPDSPQLGVTALYGHLLHLFPVNVLHTVVHLLVGLWGLAVASSTERATVYAKTIAIVFALLTVLGLLPAANTLFGMLPLHGHDVWLHAATALVSGYFGFFAHAGERRSTTS